MTDPKDKLFKTILYDTPNGSRVFIRISEAEIERIKERRFDSIPVYDLLDCKESCLSWIVAYTVINHGVYLD